MSVVVGEDGILNDEALDELYAWIDAIPLSRPKKNISRDFSDGVLCAEVVAHFLPKNIDMHNYFPASSAMQKKINWNTLNRKVFAKIGIRLSDATIQQLIEAKPGAIEQVLWDLRLKVDAQTRLERRIENSRSRSFSAAPSYDVSKSLYEDESLGDESNFSQQMSMGLNSAKMSYRTLVPPQSAPYAQFGTQDNILDNNNFISPPSQVVYRGHKMVPLALLEERDREIKSLEIANKQLLTKVNRIEALVNVKDQRIEDLTHQLINVRSLYENVTQTKWQ